MALLAAIQPASALRRACCLSQLLLLLCWLIQLHGFSRRVPSTGWAPVPTRQYDGPLRLHGTALGPCLLLLLRLAALAPAAPRQLLAAARAPVPLRGGPWSGARAPTSQGEAARPQPLLPKGLLVGVVLVAAGAVGIGFGI